MIHQLARTQSLSSRWNWLRKIGGIAALTTGVLLLIGLLSIVHTVLQSNITNSWLLLFQNNWLVKIFILHAEFSNIHAALYGLNVLDIVILLLVSVVCLSLSTIFRNAGKVWCLIAFALCLIAIILFVATQNAGRSTVMLAVLIISSFLLSDKSFSKVTAYTGILASVFLFAGDLTVGIQSSFITILFGIGYVLLVVWFFLITQILFRIDRKYRSRLQWDRRLLR